MHTHSEYSHDSQCKIEDMCLSQIEKGTNIFAVTDHFDTASYVDYDVFTPIKSSYDMVKKLNMKYAGKCKILAGVELSEGFWYKDVLEEITKMLSYDVIIGSVHLVKYKELTTAYSKINFSELPQNIVEEYLNQYFDDILMMFDTTDFDILAHLTCPLRYIEGKFKFNINLNMFEDKITAILKRTVNDEKALEVNTSGYGIINDFMPAMDIIKKYRDLGGRLITLASDAHIKENASVHFGMAMEALKDIGFKSLYYYENRRPIELKF